MEVASEAFDHFALMEEGVAGWGMRAHYGQRTPHPSPNGDEHAVAFSADGQAIVVLSIFSMPILGCGESSPTSSVCRPILDTLF